MTDVLFFSSARLKDFVLTFRTLNRSTVVRIGALLTLQIPKLWSGMSYFPLQRVGGNSNFLLLDLPDRVGNSLEPLLLNLGLDSPLLSALRTSFFVSEKLLFKLKSSCEYRNIIHFFRINNSTFAVSCPVLSRG